MPAIMSLVAICFFFFARPVAAAVLQSLTHKSSAELTEIKFFLDNPVPFTYKFLSNPPRFFVDFKKTTAGTYNNSVIRLQTPGVKAIRISKFDPSTLRVVLDLGQYSDVRISTTVSKKTVIISVYEKTHTGGPNATAVNETSDEPETDPTGKNAGKSEEAGNKPGETANKTEAGPEGSVKAIPEGNVKAGPENKAAQQTLHGAPGKREVPASESIPGYLGGFELVTGKVEVLRGGHLPAYPVIEGDSLLADDIIRTKTGSGATVAFPGGTTLTAGPASRVSVSEFGKAYAGIHLSLGMVKVSAASKGGPATFTIDTPTSSKVECKKGTVVAVMIENYTTEVIVKKGSATVVNPMMESKTVNLSASMATVIYPSTPPAVPFKVNEDAIKTLWP
ncbi:MAG: AMIN domain-containing protein [Nitrospirae bacterium]|nr:AMIN domain-containing protein [Nitrospirota bacterium]